MKKFFTMIFIFCICVFSCWPFGKSKKQKVIDAILSNKNVSEIVEIRGHDDWETKYFFVKLILTDGTKLVLRDVDFKLRGKKTDKLHFVLIRMIENFAFVQLEFDYKTYDYLAISQFQNPPDNCSECLKILYTEKSFDYLVDNHVEIISELRKFPKVPDAFVDKFILGKGYDINELKNYNFVDFNVEKGCYPVIISSEKYHAW